MNCSLINFDDPLNFHVSPSSSKVNEFVQYSLVQISAKLKTLPSASAVFWQKLQITSLKTYYTILVCISGIIQRFLKANTVHP